MMHKEIAITGISGRFANCKNIEELKEALLSGKDLITDNHKRWNYAFLNTPLSMGMLPDLEYFDKNFFGIKANQIKLIDLKTRHLLELCFEAILDSGYNPNDLRGSHTGVFLGILEDNIDEGLLKRSKAVMANMISYYLDLKGPSLSSNTGCSSSFFVLKHAVDSILNGSCDSAIVCTAQLNLHPKDSMELTQLQVLNPEGRCKSFDNDRNGYVKSEAIVAIYLQKQQNARRIYATLAGIGCNTDGYRKDGITTPSASSQLQLLKDTYQKNKLDPNDVEYIETHGTGTIVGDQKECQALADFFVNTNRKYPLNIGSIKTNVGHTEAAAGLTSLAKILIAIQAGTIPANLHFKSPAKDIPEIVTKKLMVVSENLLYRGGLIGLNAFGLSGSNSHIVVRPFYTNPSKECLSQPLLVCVSGRTEKAVEHLLNKIEEHKNNTDFVNLINTVFKSKINNYNYKGYSILGRKNKEIKFCPEEERPIWFSYSGMGSQWTGMGKDLMHFKIFQNSIKRCSKALKQYGMNLEDIILNATENILNEPQNCFPAIIAISIGLTDILFALGIKPDGIIGHSLGEIGCAYADNLITAEEAVLIAYARGYATKQTKLIPGLMASVGLNFEDCKRILPTDIRIACHNCDNNITISGPEHSVKQFVEDLKNQNIFAKLVDTANIAFHSEYIHDAGPLFLKMLQKIIPVPKLRSSKWLPSAVIYEENSFLSQYNSAEYHYHNFINPVLFSQVLKKVPNNCTFIEIAPRGLLQPIFRRALNPRIEKLHLVSKDHFDNYEFLLSVIGKISLNHNIDLDQIIKPNFPSGSSLSFISPMIQWDHSTQWKVPQYSESSNYNGQEFVFDMEEYKNSYLFGHVVNDKCLFPGSGYIYLIWKALANIMETDVESFQISIYSIKFLRITIVPVSGDITFTVNILKSGAFEICNEGAIVSSGRVVFEKPFEAHFKSIGTNSLNNEISINTEDFYKEMSLRGYKYNGVFKSVIECSVNGDTGIIQWKENWVAFIDNILQLCAFFQYWNLIVPLEIQEINIDPIFHKKLLSNSNELVYKFENSTQSLICGGIHISNVKKASLTKQIKTDKPDLLKYQFVNNSLEYFENEEDHLKESLRVSLQIVRENVIPTFINIVQYECNQTDFYQDVVQVLSKRDLPNLKYSKTDTLTNIKDTDMDLFLIPFGNDNYKMIASALNSFKTGTFIFAEINYSNNNNIPSYINDSVIFQSNSKNQCFVLLRKRPLTNSINEEAHIIINASSSDFSWVEMVKAKLPDKQTKIYLVEKGSDLGLLGYFNCVKEEMQVTNLRVFILDKNAEKFSIKSEFYKNQVQKDLAVNVLMNNKWGTYRIFPFSLIKNDENIIQAQQAFFKKSITCLKGNSLRLSEQVNIQYTSLNIKYMKKNENSRSSEKNCMGTEFSGINKNGNYVMGISKCIMCKKHNCEGTDKETDFIIWDIPEYLTLEEAASSALVYAMAYYSLFIKANLTPNKNVLILGTDDLSLAAAVLALNTKCNVFICVENKTESDYIANILPELPKNRHIAIDFSSKYILNYSFDFVFNRNDELLQRFLTVIQNKTSVINCCIKNSEPRYIEALLQNNCIIIPANFDELYLNSRSITNGIQNVMKNSKVKVLPYRSIDIETNYESILSLVENSSQEKMVFKIKTNVQLYKYFGLKCSYFDSEKSYILIGGLGGIGMELLKWMVNRGARKIILNSRRGVTDGYQAFWIKGLREIGALINVNNFDTSTLEGAEKIVDVAKNFGPVDGIFNLALVLENKPITELTKEDFVTVVSPKLYSAQQLDIVSRKCARSLSYFVVFSSIASFGSPMQANYGYANSSLERLCERRKSDNLPALAVAWGPVADVGYLAKNKIDQKILGASSQSVDSCIHILDKFLQQENPVVCSVIYENKKNSLLNKTEVKSVSELIASVLGVSDISMENQEIPLLSLGVDSITSFELKSLLWQVYKIELQPQEIRKHSIKDLENLIPPNIKQKS